MRPTLSLAVLSLALPLAPDCSAQTLPAFWHRISDWVAPPDSAHGTNQGNPAPDGEGNPVWHYEYTIGGGGLGSGNPWYDEAHTPSLWDMSWYGGAGAWAVGDNFGPAMSRTVQDHTANWYAQTPRIRWVNTSPDTFELGVTGNFTVSWNGNFSTASNVDTDVVVAHRDAGTGTLTFLHSATHEKPTDDTSVEGIRIPVDTVLTIEPGDELLYSLRSRTMPDFGTWQSMSEHRVCLVRDPIGTTYCGPAVENSTTYAGRIVASGSTDVTDGELTLKAFQLPWNSFGFFLASQTQGFIANPGGSDGNLCLSGQIGRFVAPGQILNTLDTGAASLVVDLGNVPQPSGFVSVQPGETWNVQAWYRDANPGATSNFTDALAVTFR